MADRYINLNGQLIKERQCGLSVSNRAFKYGDSLFETIRVINGKALFTEDHFSRLVRGMKELKYDIPSNWNQAFLKKEILKGLEKNEIVRGGKVRLSVYRKGEGLYLPKSNEFGFVIESFGGENNSFDLNEKGMSIGIYKEIPIFPTKLSPFKTSNCLPYISAALWSREEGFDDVILLNDKGNIVEGISSNIFISVEGMLYTPSIKEGPTAGIMRKKMIQLSKKLGQAVIETSISPAVLEEADEIFFTNSISGIRWVGSFRKKRYFHKISEKLLKELNTIAS